jgi:hypothetical protein
MHAVCPVSQATASLGTVQSHGGFASCGAKAFEVPRRRWVRGKGRVCVDEVSMLLHICTMCVCECACACACVCVCVCIYIPLMRLCASRDEETPASRAAQQ